MNDSDRFRDGETKEEKYTREKIENLFNLCFLDFSVEMLSLVVKYTSLEFRVRSLDTNLRR